MIGGLGDFCCSGPTNGLSSKVKEVASVEMLGARIMTGGRGVGVACIGEDGPRCMKGMEDLMGPMDEGEVTDWKGEGDTGLSTIWLMFLSESMLETTSMSSMCTSTSSRAASEFWATSGDPTSEDAPGVTIPSCRISLSPPNDVSTFMASSSSSDDWTSSLTLSVSLGDCESSALIESG